MADLSMQLNTRIDADLALRLKKLTMLLKMTQREVIARAINQLWNRVAATERRKEEAKA